MPASAAQKRASKKYDTKMTVQVHLKLNTATDHDILTRLSDVDSKQGYIKRLIREDMLKTTDGSGDKGNV